MNAIHELDLLTCPIKGTSLIVASAGTGKTYAITGLVLRLLLEPGKGASGPSASPLAINEILVVTFTEAATAELKDRIRRRLREAVAVFSGDETRDHFLLGLKDRYGDSAGVARLTQALNEFDEAAIFTIHGFCMRVLRDHAFASGTLFDTELVTEEDELLREIARDFWRKHFYKASPLFFYYASGCGLSPDAFLDSVKRSLSDPYLRILPEVALPDCSALEEEFLGCFENVSKSWGKHRVAVGDILTNDPSLNRNQYRKGSIPGWLSSMDSYLLCECLDCVPCECFEKFTSSKLLGAVKKGGKPPSHPFFNLCEEFKEVQARLAAAYRECVLGLKVEFLKFLRTELEERKLRRNIFFYNDLLLKVEGALWAGGGKALCDAVASRYKAALIDEFQDTDSIQYAIFHKIFGQGEAALFLIGDPKQAIYSFRGADVFTFMDAHRQIDPKFTLKENWRSEPPLVSGINTIFSNVDTAFVYPEITFESCHAAREKEHTPLKVDGESSPPLQLWFLRSDRVSEGKPITKTLARRLIPGAVAAEISRLLALGREGRALIGDRPVREADFAILVRANTEARPMRQALAGLGIHAVSYDLGNLFESHEAMELERLLAAIASPTDEGLLKAALVTDMLGLSGEELDALLSHESGWDGWVGRFSQYHEMWTGSGFFRMFRSLLSAEAVLPRLMALHEGERRCTNVLHLAEVLHRAAVESSLNPLGLRKWLSRHRSESGPRLEEHQLRLESDENAVKIITIHKSKGLEYPIVFCPYTWRESSLEDSTFVFHQSSPETCAILDMGSEDQEEHRKLAEKEQLAENLRLLYVAMTRAKNRCCLVWGRFSNAGSSAPAYVLHPSLSKGWDGTLDALTSAFGQMNDDALWEDLEGVREKAGGALLLSEMPLDPGKPLEGASGKDLALSCRSFSGVIRREWRMSSFSSLVSSQDHRAESADRDESELFGQVAVEEEEVAEAKPAGQDIFTFPRGAAAGTCLHEIFERIDFQNRRQIGSIVRETLKNHGFEELWAGPVAEMVERVLDVPLDSSYGAFSLSQIAACERLNELEFYFPLRRTGARELREALSRSLPGSGEMDIPSTLDRLLFHPLDGFMKGFMDLVLRFNGRFYILDWKSNFLGSEIEDYAREALQKPMEDSFYTLQYTLYTLALHQYLKLRIPGYSYEAHFGEVFYVFLRGVEPSAGPKFGIYKDRPKKEAIEALASTLIHHAEGQPWRP